MAFKFFTIAIHDAGSAEAELNAFLRSHKVLAVDRRWVDQGASSFWSICVDYLESAAGPTGAGRPAGRVGKVDYKDVLSPEEFAVFARLRDLRKQMAQAEAVPVYTVFTNEQLARIVQQRATTRAALEEIAGVGDARIEKYGPRVLDFLANEWNGRTLRGALLMPARPGLSRSTDGFCTTHARASKPRPPPRSPGWS